MPEPKKRLCLRCGNNDKLKEKEYAEDVLECEAGHDINLEAYLIGRETDFAERKKKETPTRRGLLDNLRGRK